ncbi:MAG TPA: hypothetical protein VJY42_03820 [Candidatus Methanomethylophilaceae archaeon]|nr:hypothetical protein [Candidatus Methanomethylophilaceae archaeon]
MIKIFDNSAVSSTGRDIKSMDVMECIKIEYDVRITIGVVAECNNSKHPDNSKLLNGLNVISHMGDNFDKIVKHLLKKYKRIGRGETESIAASILLASNGIKNYLILDEKFARNVVSKIRNDCEIKKIIGEPIPEIYLSGTIGLINHLKEKGILTKEQTSTIADDLQKSTFRINDELLSLLR